VFTVDRPARELIASNAPVEALRTYHRQQNFSFLLDEGIRLAEAGRTSLDEVLEVAYSD
jgi:type IV pilus assembly protein PilB